VTPECPDLEHKINRQHMPALDESVVLRHNSDRPIRSIFGNNTVN
jgi:hypothetical protein